MFKGTENIFKLKKNVTSFFFYSLFSKIYTGNNEIKVLLYFSNKIFHDYELGTRPMNHVLGQNNNTYRSMSKHPFKMEALFCVIAGALDGGSGTKRSHGPFRDQ